MTVEDEIDRTTVLRESLAAIFGLGGAEPGTLSAVLEKVAPEDVAAVLSDLHEEEKVRVFQALPSLEDRGTVLEEADQQSRREILEALTERERREVIGEMPVDDLVDHLEELSEDEQRRLIAGLGREEAKDVEELLGYEPDTAGGMMTTEFITIPLDSTSRDALSQIQGNRTAEIINYVYVIEAGDFLRGVVSIREILAAAPGTLVRDYMESDVVSVSVDTDREEVAAVVDKYHLQAIPVVDKFGRIRGIVTFDDVMEAVQEEHSEDMLRMAGTTAIHPFFEPIGVDAIKRLPFLVVTMLGGIAVAFVQDTFKLEIGVAIFAHMVVWVHLVSALSGNVAVVTSTVMVRGLATGDISRTRLRRAVVREFVIAMLIALALAVAVSGIFYLYSRHLRDGDAAGEAPEVGKALVALAAAMCASLTWAGLVGGLVPVLCRLSKVIDPAIASGPFVTITCDISASLIFLGFIYFLLAS